MLELDAEALLLTEPIGLYLVEQRGAWLVLWRISEGSPGDEAIEPGEMGTFEPARAPAD
jgi:hypothetical protein